MLTTAEAADLAKVPPATLRQWAARGHLACAERDARGRPLYDAAAVAAAEQLMRSTLRPRQAQTRDTTGRFGSGGGQGWSPSVTVQPLADVCPQPANAS